MAAAALAGVLLLALAVVAGADTDGGDGNINCRIHPKFLVSWNACVLFDDMSARMISCFWFLQPRRWGICTPPGIARLSLPAGRPAAATLAAPRGWASPALAPPSPRCK